MRFVLFLLPFLLVPMSVCAHPIARDNHDRYIAITLKPTQRTGILLAEIQYRLEVDEQTLVLQDMAPFRDQVDPSLFARRALEYHQHFARIFAPIFADNLLVRWNDRPVSLKVVSHRAVLRDEKGEPLGHVRGEFMFNAELPVGPEKNQLQVQETSYRDQEGQVHLTFKNETELLIERQEIPDLKLNLLPPLERPVDFDHRLRNLTVCFLPGLSLPKINPAVVAEGAVVEVPPPSPVAEPTETVGGLLEQAWRNEISFMTLFRRARESQGLFWTLLFVFAILGAAHALTPGHGKTLVAAYLVGERGTVGQALFLGLTTTLTHTGMVLLIAGILHYLPQGMSKEAQESIQMGLGLGMGLMVAGLGIWLLLQRLAGRADHIHLGDAGHSHAGHSHGHAGVLASGVQQPGWWGILVLGITGGLIPCWDAIAILVTVVGSSEFWFALPALLAFSAGLAGVLVAIGILVVQFRNFAGSRWGTGRLVRALPYLSAILVTLMGLWLCFDSVRHGH